MKVLVIGSGGREHALVWKISQSPKIKKIYCAPGSAGIGELAECVAIAPEQIEKLAEFAELEKIDLTVVGPELPLTLGIADLFESRGLRIFGPNRAAAQLEGSKAFAKEILKANHIPTAAFETFADATAAKRYLAQVKPPYVVKADGLAAGKGVLICASRQEAEAAIDEILVRKAFGQSGEKLVIEEFLDGEEASFMALTDGEHILPLASSQDHKRVFDGDRGPNTGGMGAYSPAPVVTPELHRRILDEILNPLLRGLKKKGVHYSGVIYAGLMIADDGPKVLEFNARFGDPECQPIMMRLKSDLVSLLEATIEGKLDRMKAEWYRDPAVCVVLCAGGYPGAYEKGQEIRGLEKLKHWQRGFVFHAGSAEKQGRFLTSGGRVLGVTALGTNIQEAVREVYRAIGEIEWDGMHYRRDIAQRALKRMKG
ncbi:MAG: phosphoribosylamine--glycine ligase [Deltaproteobacteria bacterium RIFCSPLOWO2_12_55_13]|nr:MAG: phosphoribosylamine--glycine ligase [Deltaproteobacteria bacterium RIFCSPLOWO2_12_55_13]